jgi:hypothetical protein
VPEDTDCFGSVVGTDIRHAPKLCARSSSGPRSGSLSSPELSDGHLTGSHFSGGIMVNEFRLVVFQMYQYAAENKMNGMLRRLAWFRVCNQGGGGLYRVL